MTSQERIELALQHKEADRIAIHDGVWETAINRWHKEGLPTDETPFSYFKYEMLGIKPDLSFRLSTETIEENDRYIITKNSNGVIRRNWKGHTSTPELLGFTIKDKKTWEEHKPLLVYDDERVDWDDARKTYIKARKEGYYLNYRGIIGYDKWGNIIGPENFLPAVYIEPEWIKDVYMTDVELHIAVVENMVAKGIEFDGAFLYDDLGYRNGTFFSPATYKEQLFPAHKRLFDFFKSKNMPVILHSCGNVNAFIPYFIEAGLTCLQPLETKAGMNLIDLKTKYGDELAFMGGIDVRAMSAEDPRVIEEEIRTKVGIAKQGGGYIYHSDHSVPDDVSFEQYKRVIELVHKFGRY